MRDAHYLITVTLSINKQEIRGIERKRGKVAVMSTKDATANVAAAAAALPKTWSPIPRWRQRERETPCHRRQVSSSVCAVQRTSTRTKTKTRGAMCMQESRAVTSITASRILTRILLLLWISSCVVHRALNTLARTHTERRHEYTYTHTTPAHTCYGPI